jgi:hypothetical protein
MMRSLAKFIMRGRLQAAILALLSIPLISNGAIGLVVLRKGAAEGLFLVIVSLAPAIVAWLTGRPSEVFFWGTFLGLLAMYIPGLCLRATASWPFTIQVSVVTAIVSVLLVSNAVPSIADAFKGATAMFLAVMQGQSPETELADPGLTAVYGFLSLGMLFNGLSGLLIARWWQSLLYNPEGFGSEFRELRLGLLSSLLFFVLLVLCYFQGAEYRFWAFVFAVPLVLVAIAIVHSFVKERAMGQQWLVLFYIMLIVFSPFVILLAVIGCIDSWLNFRSRFALSKNKQDKD